MKKVFRSVIVSMAFVYSAAYAGTQTLGVEIGVSTMQQVKAALAKQTRVSDAGNNQYSGGPMFKTDGSSYDIDGLTGVLYIFDDQKKLAGIILTMGKSRFDAIFQAISGKYKVATQERPFVGNQYARFNSADSVIEMDAPHMGFDMEVRYVRKDLMQKFNAQSEADAAAKKKQEASKF